MLTARQFEVAKIYATTNLQRKEIAAQFNVSMSAIRDCIRRIYGKLGIHDRMELTLHYSKNTWCWKDWPTYVRCASSKRKPV